MLGPRSRLCCFPPMIQAMRAWLRTLLPVPPGRAAVRAAAVGLALALTLSCDEAPAPRPQASSSAASAALAPGAALSAPTAPAGHVLPRGSSIAFSAAAQREQKPPLTGVAEERVKLARGEAKLWSPVGARVAQPVLAVLTTKASAGACAIWSQLKGAPGFLLCPPPAESAELAATGFKQAIAALQARHPGYVAPRSTLVAYAEAADGALLLMREKPSLFPRGFLIGGGYGAFTTSAVHAFAVQGGERVVFACAGCDADRTVTALLREGLSSRRVDQAEPGVEALKTEWAWLRQGDPWWQAAAAP